MTMAPAAFSRSTTAASRIGTRPASSGGAVLGRDLRGVDDVLQRHRQPCSGPIGRPLARWASSARACAIGVVAVEPGPGLHLRLALGDHGEAGLDEVGGPSAPPPAGRAARSPAVERRRVAARPRRSAAIEHLRQVEDEAREDVDQIAMLMKTMNRNGITPLKIWSAAPRAARCP
jgi:hypothetical protein